MNGITSLTFNRQNWFTLSNVSLKMEDVSGGTQAFEWPKQAFSFDQRYAIDIARDDKTKAKVNDKKAGEPANLFEDWAEISGDTIRVGDNWKISSIETKNGKVEKFTIDYSMSADTEANTGTTHPTFTVDKDGVLRTRHSLDYETESSHDVPVRAIRADGEYVEKIVNIRVGDEFRPIVHTIPSVDVNLGSHLYGFSNNENLKKGQSIGYLFAEGKNGEVVDEPFVFELIAEDTPVSSGEGNGPSPVNGITSLTFNRQDWFTLSNVSLKMNDISGGTQAFEWPKQAFSLDQRYAIDIARDDKSKAKVNDKKAGDPANLFEDWGEITDGTIKMADNWKISAIETMAGSVEKFTITHEEVSPASPFSINSNGELFVQRSLNLRRKDEWDLKVRYSLNGMQEERVVRLIITGIASEPLRIEMSSDADAVNDHVLSGKEFMGTSQPVTTERGFLLSPNPDPELSDEDADIIVVRGQSGEDFEYNLSKSMVESEVIYYRAYAVNEEGVAYGASYQLEMNVGGVAPTWSEAFPVEGAENWWASPWFGNFYLNEDSGWLMHEELGWLFAIGHPADGVWLWQEDLGWMWTHSSTYPFLYRNETGSWLFFHGQGAQRLLLFDYSENKWLVITLQ